MSTEYYIICEEHSDDMWPDEWMPSFARDSLAKVLEYDQRKILTKIGKLQLKVKYVEFASGIFPQSHSNLCQYMNTHRGCNLVVMDEYKRRWRS